MPLADQLDTPALIEALAEPETTGALSYNTTDGVQLAGYARVAGLDWGVVVERPRASALAATRLGRELAFATLLLAIAATSSFGVLIARRLTRSLQKLGHAAAALADEEATVALPQSRITEVAQLAQTVDELRQRLAARTSERAVAVAALRASEERYRLIAESTNDLISLLDRDGQFRYASPSFREMLGYDPAALLGRPAFAMVHADDAAQVQLQWAATLEQGKAQALVRYRHSGGAYRWIEARATLVQEGEAPAIVVVGRDVTARKAADERQQFLAELGPVLNRSLDYDTLLAQVAELLVRDLADHCLVHASDPDAQLLAEAHSDSSAPVAPPPLELIAEVARTGVPRLCPSPAADERQAIEAYMLVVPLAAGQRHGTLTLAIDAARPPYDEDDLGFAADVASRWALALDNAELFRQAQQAIAARDQFLSIASHELKTPLTAMMGFTQLLQRRNSREGQLSERDAKAVNTIARQASRLESLVNLLLDLSRIEGGQLRIERSPVDLRALTQRLVDDLQPTLERHSLVLEGEAVPLLILGDELRLEQAILNLMQNAIKYSPAGGSVVVRVERRDDLACIAISDQGVGIPAVALPHLFERFYRAPNAGSLQISGMGIGLYVAHENVNRHGGTINVESREGSGSTFTICLPLDPAYAIHLEATELADNE
jgi:PAS domain S-box-containing protein